MRTQSTPHRMQKLHDEPTGAQPTRTSASCNSDTASCVTEADAPASRTQSFRNASSVVADMKGCPSAVPQTAFQANVQREQHRRIEAAPIMTELAECSTSDGSAVDVLETVVATAHKHKLSIK
jgi:hypothetical protein